MLIVDTASRRVSVGLFDEAEQFAFHTSEEEASLSLFPLIKQALQQCDKSLADLESIAFCAGPGSMLGIRTAAMGIRTWLGAGLLTNTRVYSYDSLSLGQLLAQSQADAPDSFLIVTDARRNSWNALRVESGVAKKVSIIENAALEMETVPIYSFPEFPTWTKTQATITSLPYRPEDAMELEGFKELLVENAAVEPLNLRTMEFAKWNAKPRTADQVDAGA